MLGLHDAGISFAVPPGENTRYDLIVDDGERLARVQCKTGRLRGGAVRFPVCSTYGHHRNPASARRDYRGQIDYFAVYCPETRGVYLIPIEDIPVTNYAALRVEPTRNAQQRLIRHAAEYELARVESIPVRRSLPPPRPHPVAGNRAKRPANSGPRATAGAGGSSA